MTNIVDDSYVNYQELLMKLQVSTDLSLQIWAGDHFRRVLVLIMANHLENEVKTILIEFSKRKSGSELVSSFVEKSMEVNIIHILTGRAATSINSSLFLETSLSRMPSEMFILTTLLKRE